MRIGLPCPAALVALALAVPAAAQAAGTCLLQQKAELRVTLHGRAPVTPVTIDGRILNLMVDSGAVYTTISPGAAKALALTTFSTPGPVTRGVGGAGAETHSAVIDGLQVGGVAFPHMRVLVSEAMADVSDVDGILGEDILGRFDVEYDLANKAVRLFKPQDCTQNHDLGYWALGKTDIVELSRGSAGTLPGLGLSVAVSINGHGMVAVLDSGANRSVLALRAAAAAGVTPQVPGARTVTPIYGMDSRPIEAWTAPFAGFALGSEQIHDTRLVIGAIPPGQADMVLGADFFLAHRLYVANSQNRLYFSYNGGPVFRFEPPPARPVLSDY